MRISKTNYGILGFLEKIVRSHPLLYIIIRKLIRFTNIFERDFDGLKQIFFDEKINIIDVGASDGISIKYFLNNFNVNKIACFEPNRKYVSILRKIYKKKVIIYPFAVGNQNTIKKKFFFPQYKIFGYCFNIITYAHNDKKLLRFFMKDFKFNKNLTIGEGTIALTLVKKLPFKIDLLKIDTNGFELSVIQGLLKFIKKDKPVLIIEINKDNKKISKLMSKLNYRGCYYSTKFKKFSTKVQKGSTNKYFLQNTKTNKKVFLNRFFN